MNPPVSDFEKAARIAAVAIKRAKMPRADFAETIPFPRIPRKQDQNIGLLVLAVYLLSVLALVVSVGVLAMQP